MVYTLGESLLDIIFSNPENLTPRPGGGMLNTSVSLARSRVNVSLISELGDDKTAEIVVNFLKGQAVNTRYIKKYYHQKTSIALAFLDELKVPSFSIYKSYPKNRRLIFPPEFSSDDILVFGSLYSLDPAIRNDVKMILASAKTGGAILVYDPNIRHHNLEEPEIRLAFEENVAFADIIKGSDDDFLNVFGPMNVAAYYSEIKKINPDALFVFTKGAEGVCSFHREIMIKLPAKEINVVSTIGAGDAFNAGMVYYLEKTKSDRKKVTGLNEVGLGTMLETGLKYSAAVCETVDNYVPNNFL